MIAGKADITQKAHVVQWWSIEMIVTFSDQGCAAQRFGYLARRFPNQA
jgi:hypothetical protein